MELIEDKRIIIIFINYEGERGQLLERRDDELDFTAHKESLNCIP